MSGTGARTLGALVIGGGPAGLATSHALQRRGITHRILERGEGPGWVWANLYDSLTLHTGRHMSHLPGKGFDAGTPLFVPRADFVRYLDDYTHQFALPLDAGVDVTDLARHDGTWVAETSRGLLSAKAVVLATGIVSNPRIPDIPGREAFGGTVLHSSAYRRPAPFVGQRVLIVGVGNSGGEIGSELARAGAHVTVAVRSGANVIPRDLGGIPIQYCAYVLRKFPKAVQHVVSDLIRRMGEAKRGPPVLPRPAHSALEAIPLIGFNLVDEIRAGRIAVRPGLAALTAGGARFSDGREEPFDVVLLATGFRAAMQPLRDQVRFDAKGFGERRDRVVSLDQPGLFYVGHNYDSSGGIMNIRKDSVLAAERVAEALR
jgi:cation diffusion facilitator CzcD-associated flavoprotein CzcO